MSKVNVYLPEPLHDKVKLLKLPISRICQDALWGEIDKADGADRGCNRKGCDNKAEWFVQAEGWEPSYVCSAHLSEFILTDGGQTMVRALAS